MAKAKKSTTNAANTNDTSSAPKSKRRGPAQTEIPGTERKKVPAVEAAFEDWDEARAKTRLSKSSEDAHYDAVITAMRNAKITTYKFPSQDGTTITITLSDKTRLKVHKAKPDAFTDEAA